MKSRQLQENKNKVTLYIATHNKTGLKYFGKTVKYFTQEELQKYYHGSGLYWLEHLKVHGDDVTMEVYGIFEADNVKAAALKFSEEHNIVNAKNNNKKVWANQIPENGLGGGNMGELNGMFGNTHSDEVKNVISEANKDRVNVRNIITGECYKVSKEEWINNVNLEAESKGRVKGAKERKAISERTKGQNNPMYGGHSEETKQKMRKPKGPQVKLECPYCGLKGGATNLKRYHFDKCKQKGK